MAKRKKSEEKVEEEKAVNWDSQTKLVIIFMAILVLAVLFTYLVIKESKKFNYLGVDFTYQNSRCPKNFYLAEFPLGDNNFLRFCFRQDPRKLNINITSPIFLTGRVALAMDSSYAEKCEDSIISGTTLSVFLSQLGAEAFGATTNKTEALALNRTYVNCTTSPDSVIVFREANENIIKKEGLCYIVEIKDCSIMNATERFMIGMWASTKGVKI